MVVDAAASGGGLLYLSAATVARAASRFAGVRAAYGRGDAKAVESDWAECAACRRECLGGRLDGGQSGGTPGGESTRHRDRLEWRTGHGAPKRDRRDAAAAAVGWRNRAARRGRRCGEGCRVLPFWG